MSQMMDLTGKWPYPNILEYHTIQGQHEIHYHKRMAPATILAWGGHHVFMFYMFYGLLLFATRVNSITDNTFPGTITVWVTFVFAKCGTGYVGKVGVATCNTFPLK